MDESYWDENNWYLIRTRPKQESRAAKNLRSYSIETFLPMFKERRFNKFTGEAMYTVKPLFPSYVFARFKLRDLYHKVRYTRGVRELVSFNDQPSVVEDEVIEVIQLRIGSEGLVVIDDELRPGDCVLVTGGPMANLHGLFERQLKDSDRVMILLETVNFQARVEISRAYLRKCDAATVH